MIGSIIGGIVIGGLISSSLDNRSRNKELEAQNARLRKMCNQALEASMSSSSTRESRGTRVDAKLERQVEFFDEFRSLDNRLARNVREGYKGVTYLIKGMDVSRTNQGIKNCLKNIRNYRGQLSHDKRKWKNIPAPSESLMNDLKRAKNWVDSNYSYASKLVYKGKSAFSCDRR